MIDLLIKSIIYLQILQSIVERSARVISQEHDSLIWTTHGFENYSVLSQQPCYQNWMLEKVSVIIFWRKWVKRKQFLGESPDGLKVTLALIQFLWSFYTSNLIWRKILKVKHLQIEPPITTASNKTQHYKFTSKFPLLWAYKMQQYRTVTISHTLPAAIILLSRWAIKDLFRNSILWNAPLLLSGCKSNLLLAITKSFKTKSSNQILHNTSWGLVPHSLLHCTLQAIQFIFLIKLHYVCSTWANESQAQNGTYQNLASWHWSNSICYYNL